MFKAIKELSSVIGIGKKFARQLYEEYNIKNVADLKRAVRSGKIKVGNKIKVGLKYYGVVKGNIPRNEVFEIERYLQSEASKIDPNLRVVVTGSYRRGKQIVDDIDVLVYHPSNRLEFLKLLIDTLKQQGFLLDVIDKNYKVVYRGFCKYNRNIRRIDIRMVPYQSIPTALLYFTGPGSLNTFMRQIAQMKNMLLNEYGLYQIVQGKRLPLAINSEEDVFRYLGLEYLPPEQRDNFTYRRIKKGIL